MWKTKSLATKVAEKKVKYYLTKKRKQKIARAKWFTLLAVSAMAICIVLGFIEDVKKEVFRAVDLECGINYQTGRLNAIDGIVEESNSTLREVTAYNAGIEAQTDNTPCISASGDDICVMLERGDRVCATNFVPLGTRLHIKNYGDCIVLDRMNSRFKNRVDIAMKASEYERAVKFGLQSLEVSIIN